MKKYKINIFSNTIAIISVLISIPFFITIVDFIQIENSSPVFFVLFFGILGLIFFLVAILSKGKVEIILSEEGFKHIWIRKFFIGKEQDIILDWSEIQEYFFWEDRVFEYFQLNLSNERKYRIYRWMYFFQKDDFREFERDFPKYLKKLNQSGQKKIKVGKTLYDEPVLRKFTGILAIISGVLLCYELLTPHSTVPILPLVTYLSIYLFYWLKMKSNKINKGE